MEKHIYGIFYTILFVVLCTMFIGTFTEKRSLRHKWYGNAIIVCLIMADYLVSVGLNKRILLKEAVIIGLGTIFMCLYFKQNRIKTTILVLLYQGICFVMDYIAIFILSRFFPSITMERLNEPMVNSLLGILSQMLLVCFVLILRRYMVKNSSGMLTEWEWMRFSIFPVFTIGVLIALLAGFEIPKDNGQKDILIYIAFGLLVMNIIVFCLINDVIKRETQIAEDQLLLAHIKSETEKYRTISENYNRQKRREHEFKNQLAVIAALARDHKVEEISHYLTQYHKESLLYTNLIDTNHVIVNAILNSKYQEAREKGIVFIIKVNDLSDLKVKAEDLVLILSNLLNNAIEANEACKEPMIKLKFMKKEDQMLLSVANTYLKEPMTDGSRYLTTKTEDQEEHGIGLENIKETVKKYHGTCVIQCDKKFFKVAILI